MRRLAVALLAILALAACGNDGNTEPEARPQLDGVWNSADVAGTYRDLNLDITESSSGSVSGEWTAEEPRGAAGGVRRVSGQISGAHSHPEVTLTVLLDGANEATYTATLEAEDRMDGTWVFSPDSRYDVTFQR